MTDFLFVSIINLIVSAIFFVLGYLLIKKHKINIIHDYHRQHVKDEDIKAYTTEYGKALNSIGLGLSVTGVLEYNTKIEWVWIIYIIGFAYAFFVIHKAQMKYNNKRWFW